jgi:hypothetical protein
VIQVVVQVLEVVHLRGLVKYIAQYLDIILSQFVEIIVSLIIVMNNLLVLLLEEQRKNQLHLIMYLIAEIRVDLESVKVKVKPKSLNHL